MTATPLASVTVANVDAFLGHDSQRIRRFVPYVVAVAAVTALTAVLAPLRHHLTLLNVGMLYLLLVVLLTSRFGLWPGILASVLVNLGVNYFFVPPVHQFDVRESGNIIALGVFLMATAATAGLLARAERGERLAHEREKENALLFNLSQSVVADPGARTVLPLLAHKVRESLGASSAAIFVGDAQHLNLAAAAGVPANFELTGDERLLFSNAIASAEPACLGVTASSRGPRIFGRPSVAAPIVAVPMIAAGNCLGVLRVAGPLAANTAHKDSVRLLRTFASVAALAVNHQRLLRELTATEALREADVLKSAVLSTVSHELRTPLASIKAPVTSLLEATGQWDDVERREFLSAINEETDRLTVLITNLLDLSRLEGGALRLERDWYDVGELLETICGRLQPIVGAHLLALETGTRVGDAYVDYVLIGQVIQNLVENAAKFSPAGLPIHVMTRAKEDGLELRVEDEGPGIAPADYPHVFEKFFRGQASGRSSGVGLGLAISRGIIEAHGGEIRAEQSTHGGAAFVITIPAVSFRPGVTAVGEAPVR